MEVIRMSGHWLEQVIDVESQPMTRPSYCCRSFYQPVLLTPMPPTLLGPNHFILPLPRARLYFLFESVMRHERCQWHLIFFLVRR